MGLSVSRNIWLVNIYHKVCWSTNGCFWCAAPGDPHQGLRHRQCGRCRLLSGLPWHSSLSSGALISSNIHILGIWSPPPACGAEVLVFVRASNHQYYEVWRHVFELFVLLSPSVCSVLLRSSNHCQSNIWVWELISQDYNFFRKGLVQIRLWLHDHQIKRTILFVCGIDMILFLCTWGLHWIIKQPNWTQHRSSPTK